MRPKEGPTENENYPKRRKKTGSGSSTSSSSSSHSASAESLSSEMRSKTKNNDDDGKDKSKRTSSDYWKRERKKHHRRDRSQSAKTGRGVRPRFGTQSRGRIKKPGKNDPFLVNGFGDSESGDKRLSDGHDINQNSGTSSGVHEATVDDADLVDYDEYGSSSSSSSSSCSCLTNNKDNDSASETETELNELTMHDDDGNSSEGSDQIMARKDRDVRSREVRENRACSNGGDESDKENLPCSSSSIMGERRDSSVHKSSAPSTSKMFPVDETGVQPGLEILEPIPDSQEEQQAVDKYKYSGIGRHFGKRKALSSNSLLGSDHSMGDTSAGGSGGESSSIEWLGWLMRLKAVTIVFLGTLLVLSMSSLLFVFPLIVDPILLGLEANFSKEPVNCRTIEVRHMKGSLNCSILSSCRAGCTADVFQCSFIDVEYSYYAVIEDIDSNATTTVGNDSEVITNNLNKTGTPGFSTLVTKNGTLYININGCGYPPLVNCTEFLHIYGTVGTEFKCFYSAQNESFVVPYYNHDEEKYHLFLAIFVPVFLSAFCAIVLFLMLKCFNNKTRSIIINRSTSKLKLIEKEDGGTSIKSQSSKKSKKGSKKKKKLESENSVNNGIGPPVSTGQQRNGPKVNGTIPKSNGHLLLQDTVSGLTGMKDPNKLHEDINRLPHQHDGHEQSFPYVIGSSLPTSDKKTRYVKKTQAKSNLFTTTTVMVEHENPHSKSYIVPNLQEHEL